MPWAVLGICAALLASPATSPTRTLLLGDPLEASWEQQLVHHLLQQELAAAPGTELIASTALPPGMARAARLRQQAEAQLAEARRSLQTLAPEAALVAASRARIKLERVAMISGEMAPLCEALSLQAAALLHLDAARAAGDIFELLLVLRPSWQVDTSLFNPSMQRHVRHARARLERSSTRKVRIDTFAPQAAIFVDGAFVAFGHADVQLATCVAHYVWVLAPDGQTNGTRLASSRKRRAPLALQLPLWPGPAQDLARYDATLTASRAPGDGLDPHSAVLRAMQIDEVLVLAYREGQLRLTRFLLHEGVSRQSSCAALITDLFEAQRAVQTLRRDVRAKL